MFSVSVKALTLSLSTPLSYKWIFMHVSPSIHLSICLSVSLSVYLSLCVSNNCGGAANTLTNCSLTLWSNFNLPAICLCYNAFDGRRFGALLIGATAAELARPATTWDKTQLNAAQHPSCDMPTIVRRCCCCRQNQKHMNIRMNMLRIRQGGISQITIEWFQLLLCEVCAYAWCSGSLWLWLQMNDN